MSGVRLKETNIKQKVPLFFALVKSTFASKLYKKTSVARDKDKQDAQKGS